MPPTGGNDATATFRAIADFSAITKGAKDAARALQELQSTAAKKTSGKVNITAVTQGINNAATAANKKLASLTTGLNAFQKSTGQSFGARVTAGMKAMGSAAQATTQQTKTTAGALQTTTKAAQQTGAAFSQTGKSTAGAARGFSSFSNSATKATNTFQRTSAETRKLNRSLDAVGDATRRLGGGLNRIIGTFATLAGQIGVGGGALEAVGVGMFIAGSAAVALGIKFDAMKEQQEVAFSSLLGNIDAAKTAIQDINVVAAKTPFRQQELVSVVQGLLAGGIALNDILKDARGNAQGIAIDIGDASAAAGGGVERLQGLVRAFQQIAAKGRLQAQEVLQIANTGVPIFKILQEELGLTALQIGEIGKQGVSAQDFFKAFSKGVKDFNIAGFMEKQSHTLNGIISTIQDNLQIGLGLAFEGLFNLVKKNVEGIANVMQTFVDRAASVGFFAALTEQFPAVAAVIKTVGAAIKSIVDVIVAAGPAVTNFVQAFVGFTAAGLLTFLSALTAALTALAKVLDAIPDSIKSFLGVMLGLGFAFKALKSLIPIAAMQAFYKNILLITKAIKSGSLVNSLHQLGASIGGKPGISGFATTGAAPGMLIPQLTTGNVSTVNALSAAFTGLNVPMLAVAATAAAVGAAFFISARHASEARKSYEGIAEGADHMAKSLDLGNQKIAETNDLLASQGETLSSKAIAEFSKQYADLIATIKSFPIEDRLSLILGAGNRLLQQGASEKDALAQVNKLVQSLDIKLTVPIEIGDLTGFDSQIHAIQAEVSQLFANTNKDMFDINLANQWVDLTTKGSENLKNIAMQVGSAIDQGNLGQAVLLMQQFDKAVKASGLSTAAQADIEQQFVSAVAKADGATKDHSRDLKTYADLFLALGDAQTKGIDEVTRQGAALVGAQLTVASFASAFEHLKSVLPGVADLLTHTSDEIDKAGKASQLAAEQVQKLTFNAEDLGSGLQSFFDIGSIKAPTAKAAKKKKEDDPEKKALDVTKAVIKQLEAEKELAKVQAKSLDIETKKLEIAKRQADLGLKQAQLNVKKTQQEADLAASDKLGATEIAQKQIDAESALADVFDAQQKVVDANNNLTNVGTDFVLEQVNAVIALKDAVNDVKDAQKKQTETTDDAGGSAKDAALTTKDLIKQTGDQAKAAQQFQADLQTLVARNAPQEIIDQFAKLGDKGAEALHVLATSSSNDFQTIIDNMKTTLDAGTPEIVHRMQVIGILMRSTFIAALSGIKANIGDIVRSLGLIGVKSDLAEVSRVARELNIPLEGLNPGRRMRHGGIEEYARGGVRPLPRRAGIQRGPLVSWAETGTGGEAFIPLRSPTPGRSIEVWRQVGQRLGILPGAKGFNVGGLYTPSSGQVSMRSGGILSNSQALMDSGLAEAIHKLNRSPRNVQIVNQTQADPRKIARETAWVLDR